MFRLSIAAGFGLFSLAYTAPCHMPAIARTVGDVNMRSHTFKFVSPVMTERYGIPNPCNARHTDETPARAIEALESWPEVSPWRVAR